LTPLDFNHEPWLDIFHRPKEVRAKFWIASNSNHVPWLLESANVPMCQYVICANVPMCQYAICTEVDADALASPRVAAKPKAKAKLAKAKSRAALVAQKSQGDPHPQQQQQQQGQQQECNLQVLPI